MQKKENPRVAVLKNHFGSNPYTYLFIFTFVMLLISPLVKYPIVNQFLGLLLMLSVLKTISLPRPLMIFTSILAVCAFASAAAFHRTDEVLAGETGALITLAIYLLFLLTAVAMIAKKVFAEKNITMDTIQGGVAVYLLIGITFGLIYALLCIVIPDAIQLGGAKENILSLYYFSFVTLTTVGYGDILPVSPIVKSFAIIEAVIGPVYLTVLVARLVGLHLAKRME